MRRAIDRMLVAASGACAILALLVMAMIIAVLLWRGGSALSWEFLTDTMEQAGAGGGILYNVVGTLILVGTAVAVSLPIATSIALVHGVYLRSRRARERLWLILTVLHGIPSILFGLFGLMLFVRYFGWGKSWLAGGILLGLMIVPTVSVAFMERVRALPVKYLETAASLGLGKSQIIWSVILPQCGTGLLTGSLLGLARAAGETAPIMFTATIFAGATIPQGIRESPVLSLPYHIFTLSQDSFDPAAAARVWAAAFVLFVLVFMVSALALPMRLRIREEARHG
jgi:phosphate transport system permease protein